MEIEVVDKNTGKVVLLFSTQCEGVYIDLEKNSPIDYKIFKRIIKRRNYILIEKKDTKNL